MEPQSPGRSLHVLFLELCLLFGASGCMATQGWVQDQMAPLTQQVAEVESRLGHTATQADRAMGQMAAMETHLDQTAMQANLALKNLEHLRLEQRFVLSVQEGAHFPVESARVTAEAQHAIDEFLRTLNGAHDVIFLVAGHTDSTGPEEYNDALGQQRASSVARYLITRKGISPLRVTAVSYGERVPMADNTTPQGRAKNRRVEIQIYKEIIASAPGSQRLELERTSAR